MGPARLAGGAVALALGLCLLPAQPPLRADEPAEPADSYSRSLSLRECVGLAVNSNSDLAVEGFNPEIRKAERDSLYGEFDPVVFFKSSTNKAITDAGGGPLDGVLAQLGIVDAIASSDIKEEAGIRKKWELGTQTELKTTLDRTKTSSIFNVASPQFTYRSEFTITQPLLRGFGWTFNNLKIFQGDVSRIIADAKYAEVTLDVVSNVEKAYWDLAAANRELDCRKLTHELTEKLLVTAREKVQTGGDTVAAIQAEADLATQKDGLLKAQAGVNTAKENLKKLLFPLGDPDYWKLDVQVADAVPPDLELPQVADSVSDMTDKRPEWKAARKEIVNKVCDVIRAENDALPKLDFKYSYARQAADPDSDFAVRDSIFENFFDYTVTLEFEMILGNRDAKNKIRKAQLEVAQSRAKLQGVERKIGTEVLEAYREAKTSKERVEATKKATELTQKKLQAETEKYNLGLASIQFVLQYTRDLAEARLAEVKALVDYHKAWVKLRRALGTTLESYDLQTPRS
ncbi:MAG: TolC family protein [Planctomycetes bacterium]|nr:TolC family protein [Planctomycetota bacterium]